MTINYWIKSKKVYQSIWKQKEDFSQDFISYLMKNFSKFLPKPKTQKLSKDTSINVSKVLGNWK